ncbi:META domain-containing protein [Deinococcus malanensis]|uniref:META domain-containing protein n=1 Tax=Deinococcus malanensis TaxID=1706855 RepID=UPI003638A455
MHSLSVLLSLAALTLVGAAGAQVTLTNTTWTLSQMTVSTQPVALPAGIGRPTLRLDGRFVAGGTGCNTYRGPYIERGGMLTLGSLATTRRDCPGPGGAQESRYLNLLQHVTRYQLSGSTLTLFAGNRDRLVFQAGSAANLPAAGISIDGTWLLSGGQPCAPCRAAHPASHSRQGA